MNIKILMLRCLGRGKGLYEEMKKRKDLSDFRGIYTSYEQVKK